MRPVSVRLGSLIERQPGATTKRERGNCHNATIHRQDDGSSAAERILVSCKPKAIGYAIQFAKVLAQYVAVRPTAGNSHSTDQRLVPAARGSGVSRALFCGATWKGSGVPGRVDT